MNNQANMQNLQQITAGAMQDIIGCFKDSLGAKITVIVRVPDNDDADFMMTSDTIDGIQGAVTRSKVRGEVDVKAG